MLGLPDGMYTHLMVWSLAVLLTAVIFVALREMICWYLRLTPIVALLEKVVQHLDNIEKGTSNRMLPRAERVSRIVAESSDFATAIKPDVSEPIKV
ncbi:MAG: hypothetical protein ACRECG_03820 [Bradyrhizobium sp.]